EQRLEVLANPDDLAESAEQHVDTGQVGDEAVDYGSNQSRRVDSAHDVHGDHGAVERDAARVIGNQNGPPALGDVLVAAAFYPEIILVDRLEHGIGPQRRLDVQSKGVIAE